MQKKVNVCIVGGAGSGMTAAICLKQAGVENVLLLEKNPNVGGCTGMSAGMFGVDTPVQHRQGLYYSADDMYRDMMTIFNWNCDAKLVRKWICGSGKNFEWLEDLGCRYDLALTEAADVRLIRNTMHRMADWNGEKWIMRPQGPTMVKCLKENCAKYGVEIMTRTRAKHLIAENGTVCGVIAETKDGEELRVEADAVILCTGSISANQELVKRFYHYDNVEDIRIMANVPHNTGDGLIMAEEVGAANGNTMTLYIGPQNHYADASEITGMISRRAHGIRVNINGERFSDESLPFYSEYGDWMKSVAVENQPKGISYTIMDQKMIDDILAGTEFSIPTPVPSLYDEPMTDKGGFETGTFRRDEWREHVMPHIAHEAEKGRCKVCETWEEAAAFIGCETDALEETVAHYNVSCACGYDDEFLKNKNYLLPLTKAPYYVFLGRTGIDTCLGGVRVDSCQRVLHKDTFRPIPGLYAAGVMTSGWTGGLYAVNGSEMSYTIFSGRNAAAEALKYCTK